MSGNIVNRLIILGAIIIFAIVTTQTYILIKTWDIMDQEFDQTARIMLRRTAERLAQFQDTDLPKIGLISRTSSNYYAVNINSNIDANVLEDYLIQEMGNHSLKTDFQYGVYNCHSKDLVYGNYCKLEDKESLVSETTTLELPTFNDLDYYFVVSFPSRESFLVSNMNMAILLSLISLFTVAFFLYSIYIIIKQKRLSELQKDFINNMTHEFKTPISSIKIASDVLFNHNDIKSNPRLQKYADIIREQNDRLNNQVEKVLNLAKLEKNSFKLNKEKINVNETLSKLILAENLRVKDTILQDFEERHIYINADVLHFSNVITNIIDNAIKYSGDDVEITVSTEIDSSNYIISISDNGIGISEDEMIRIFDKFYRVSTGDLHDVKGFGLGLFYVQNICNSHQWILEVESELGIGTKFNIKIPKNNERKS